MDRTGCWSISGIVPGQTLVRELPGHVGGGGHAGARVCHHGGRGHGHGHGHGHSA